MKTSEQRRWEDQFPEQKRRMRKGLYILPSLFTTANIAAGYYAIAHTLHGTPVDFDVAAKAIGVAVVADGLDGRIARMTSTTSDFGRELDSLADVITFGVAPAVLAWVWGFRSLPDYGQPELQQRLVQWGLIVTFLFVVAGASRLARFNIQTNPRPSNPGRPGRKYFVGMPIPAGAGVIGAVVHFMGGQPLPNIWLAPVWLALLFVVALLMVSAWRFYSFKELNLRSRHRFQTILLIGIVGTLIWFYSPVVLFILAIGYMLSGIFTRISYGLRRRPVDPSYKEAADPR